MATDIQNRQGIKSLFRWTDAVYICLLAIFSYGCMKLFYRMTIAYQGKYPSDMKYYVNIIKDGEAIHDARLLGFVFRRLWDLHHTTVEISCYLALVIAGIIVANFIFIRFFLKEDGVAAPRWTLQMASMAALFMGPIYVPIIHEWFYKNSFQTFAWHSPTQHSMILFALIGTVCFLKMFINYEEKVHLGWWLASAVTISLSAYAKPGFFISLGMTVVAVFLIELFSHGREGMGRRFGKLFFMGCALIPGAVYLAILQRLEFPENGQDGGGIAINPLHILEREHLFIGFLCSLTFAIVVFAINHRKLKDRKYLFMFMIFIMGVLQWVLFTETGSRSGHGNFGWGRQCGDYMIMLTSLTIAIENFFDKHSLFKGDKTRRGIYFAVLVILVLMHVGSQFFYFCGLLQGQPYGR